MTDAEKLKNEFNFSLLNKNAHEIKKLKAIFEDFKSELFGSVYPVGSIYMSASSVSPESLFGGKWSQLKGRFLLGADDTYTAGSKGGAASHTHTTGDHALTLNELAEHNHMLNYTGSSSTGGTAEYLYLSGLTKIMASSARNTINTRISGEGAAHNHGKTGSTSNLPPYLAVYIWKRTA